MKSSIKITVFALMVAVSVPLFAERRRAVAPPTGVLSIEFLDVPAAGATLLAAGSDTWIDLQEVSQEAGSKKRSVRIRRQFAIRIVRSGELSWGTATIRAKLDAPDGRSLMRIDGQPLGRTPLVVDSRAAIGASTIHTLEIEVSDSVSAGPLGASISWEVTAQ